MLGRLHSYTDYAKYEQQVSTIESSHDASTRAQPFVCSVMGRSTIDSVTAVLRIMMIRRQQVSWPLHAN
jgi:hypothetical protein